VQQSKEAFASLLQASTMLVSSKDPEQTLHDVVEQARAAAAALWVSVILVDELGYVEKLILAGLEKPIDLDQVIRPNGLSMQTVRTGKIQVIEDTEKERARVHPNTFREGVGAMLCLPLSLMGKRIGIMWICYDEPRSFTEDEIQALQLYVNKAAIAYGSARQIRELEHLHQAAHKLASAAGLEEVLLQIAKSAREVLAAHSAVIWSYDEVHNAFLPDQMVADGIDPEHLSLFRGDELRSGGTTEIVMERGYLAVTDIDDPAFSFLGPTGHGLRGRIRARAFQGIALCVGEERLGVLYVNYERARAFGAEQRATLEAFAAQAALSLKRVRLLDQVRQARDAAATAAEMSVLGELEPTLNAIVEGTQKTVRSDAIVLYTYDQNTDTLRYPPRMLGVWDTLTPAKFTEVPRNSFIFDMLRSDKPYIVNSTLADPIFKGRRFAVQEEIKSCIVMPLRVGDRRVGVMFVNYRSPHHFTDDEVAYIDHFANQAAVAIRNVQLYEELRVTKGMVGARTALMWMGMASSAWRHSIEGSAVNIRNALTLLRAETQVWLDDPVWQSLQSALDLIDEQARAILDKPITPPLASEEGVHVFGIHGLVKERMHQLARTEPFQKITLHLDLRPEADVGVRANPDWLRRALDLMSDNAVEAMEDVPHRSLNVSTRLAGERVEIVIADTGTGIPPDVQADLFSKRIESSNGLGMGLLMVQAILQTYGGDVRVDSSDKNGTTVVIWLPTYHQDAAE
jgi:GAF domain-containing protein/nitrogen-specific signal transduction histidine kinase